MSTQRFYTDCILHCFLYLFTESKPDVKKRGNSLGLGKETVEGTADKLWLLLHSATSGSDIKILGVTVERVMPSGRMINWGPLVSGKQFFKSNKLPWTAFVVWLLVVAVAPKGAILVVGLVVPNPPNVVVLEAGWEVLPKPPNVEVLLVAGWDVPNPPNVEVLLVAGWEVLPNSVLVLVTGWEVLPKQLNVLLLETGWEVLPKLDNVVLVAGWDVAAPNPIVAEPGWDDALLLPNPPNPVVFCILLPKVPAVVALFWAFPKPPVALLDVPNPLVPPNPTDVLLPNPVFCCVEAPKALVGCCWVPNAVLGWEGDWEVLKPKVVLFCEPKAPCGLAACEPKPNVGAVELACWSTRKL